MKQYRNMFNSKAVVSFANEEGRYRQAQQRLETSLIPYTGFDVLSFHSEVEIGAPKHADDPYAFKIYCFEKAREFGYEQILYLDSSVYAIKDIAPIFEIISSRGYVMQEAASCDFRTYSPYRLRDWYHPEGVDFLNFNSWERKHFGMYGNAGLLGLDFRRSDAETFFDRWKQAQERGLFKGSWKDHRHDMAVGSLIANRLQMHFEPPDTILQYVECSPEPFNDSIILMAQGM